MQKYTGNVVQLKKHNQLTLSLSASSAYLNQQKEEDVGGRVAGLKQQLALDQ